MDWFIKEKSFLVKAWHAAAEYKQDADNTVAIAPNGNFMVYAKVGILGRGSMGQEVTLKDFAGAISDYIIDQGWQDDHFEVIGAKLKAVFDQYYTGKNKHLFEEIEVFLVQNLAQGQEDIDAKATIRIKDKIPAFV